MLCPGDALFSSFERASSVVRALYFHVALFKKHCHSSCLLLSFFPSPLLAFQSPLQSLINNRSHSFNSQLPTSLYNTHTFTQCTLPPSSRLSSLPSPSPTPLRSSPLTRTLSGSLTALRLLSGPLSTLTPGTFLFS